MKMQVRDLEVEVTVQPSRDGMTAYFEAMVSGQRYSSRTWNDLYKTLMKATKREKVRVRVPFLKLDVPGGEWKAGVAVGVHAGSNNIEVEATDYYGRPSKAEQLDVRYGYVVFDPSITDEEKHYRLALGTQARVLADKIDEFDKAHTFRLRDAVTNAIEEEVNAPDEAAS